VTSALALVTILVVLCDASVRVFQGGAGFRIVFVYKFRKRYLDRTQQWVCLVLGKRHVRWSLVPFSLVLAPDPTVSAWDADKMLTTHEVLTNIHASIFEFG
jgi:hypothetical protein